MKRTAMQMRPELLNGVRVPYGAATGALIAMTKNADDSTRWAAFVALAHDPSPQAYLALCAAAQNADARVRRMALESLGGRSSDEPSVELVQSLLDDPWAPVVRTACQVAAKRGMQELHDSILALVRARDPATRETALEVLRVLWHPQDHAVVFDVFREESSPRLRKAAGWTLRSHATLENWRELFDAWRIDEVHRHRIWACELMAEFGAREDVDSIQSLAHDADGHVRRAAADARSAVQGRNS
jgi:HEAT repeat protein